MINFIHLLFNPTKFYQNIAKTLMLKDILWIILLIEITAGLFVISRDSMAMVIGDWVPRPDFHTLLICGYNINIFSPFLLGTIVLLFLLIVISSIALFFLWGGGPKKSFSVAFKCVGYAAIIFPLWVIWSAGMIILMSFLNEMIYFLNLHFDWHLSLIISILLFPLLYGAYFIKVISKEVYQSSSAKSWLIGISGALFSGIIFRFLLGWMFLFMA